MATLTLTIPDELLATYQRFQAENGAAWAEAFLVGKLKELQQRHAEADAKAFQAAKERLTDAERAQIPPAIRTRLGL